MARRHSVSARLVALAPWYHYVQPIHRAPLWLRGSAANAPLELTFAMMRSSRYHICKIRSPRAGLRINSESAANAPLELACAMMRSSRYHVCKIHSPCAGLRANSESEANAPLELSCAMMRSSLYHICKIRSPCAAGAHHRASAVCSHTFACFAVLPLLRPLKSYVLP